VSSVARLMDWMPVSATKPIRHSTTLSGSVQFSVCLLLGGCAIGTLGVLTVVAEEVDEASVGVSDAHEEYLSRVVEPALR